MLRGLPERDTLAPLGDDRCTPSEHVVRHERTDRERRADELEGELIRALGVDGVEAVLAAAGGLASFRMFQHQPAQRENPRPVEAQLHRWLRSSSTRFHRYLRLLVEALDLERLPQPLAEVLGNAVQPG